MQSNEDVHEAPTLEVNPRKKDQPPTQKDEEHALPKVGSKRRSPVPDTIAKDSGTPRKKTRIEVLQHAHLSMVEKGDGFLKALQHYHVVRSSIEYLNTPREIMHLLKLVKSIEQE